jgi:hypothetical protein
VAVSTDKKKSVFFYHANAVAVGGVIFRPTPEIIEAQAQVSLPITGGYGASRVGQFRHREFVSFESAHSFVAGSESEDRTHFNSLATTVTEGFSMLRVLTARRIVARVSSMHLNDPDAEPEITVVGSHFEALQIAGFPVEFDFQPAFHGHNTFDDLKDKLGISERKGYVLSSIITNVRCKAPGVEVVGQHTLFLKQFGLIHIGEVLITRHSRRVAMLRLEMGCPLESNCSANIAEGDGNMP